MTQALADGRSWVNCPKHGVQNCAMKFGLDQRCAECVLEALGAWTVVRPAPFLDPTKAMNIFKVFNPEWQQQWKQRWNQRHQ